MAANVQRGTPGRLLLLWAFMLPVVVLFAWRVHLHRDKFEWVEYPTGLGDRQFYSSLGKNDFYEPNLRFGGLTVGLFRRSVEPLDRQDDRMLKIAKEEGGRCFVYADQTAAKTSPSKPATKRIYVKSGDDKYLEFGERKHWPDYQPPKAIPAP